MICWHCVTGLHLECIGISDFTEDIPCCCFVNDDPDAQMFVKEKRSVGRPMLDPSQVTDVKSTGRKRSDMLAPIFEGMVCEWAFLKYAGGGIQPIVGCEGNTMIDQKGSGERHHGPDKNTLNNSVGVNLHRICQHCHKRWHGLNDPYYDKRPKADLQFLPRPGSGTVWPHDPLTRATEADLEASREYWATRNENRGNYPIALPEDQVVRSENN